MTLFDKIINRKSKIENPQSGLYHYRRDGEDEKSRVHLRLDPDGHGTLIVNANRILHLNPTAALMAHTILKKIPEPDAVRLIRRTYHVGAAQARADLATVCGQLRTELARSTNWGWKRSCRLAPVPLPRTAWTWRLPIAVIMIAPIVTM